MPIGEAIEAFHARGDLLFGIPGHLGGRGAVVPDAARWTGIEAFRADVGMDKGIDSRHQSWQVEPTAMQLFAHPEARAVLVFTPTYYGVSADVAALADVAHAHDVPLLTDDAWGLGCSPGTRSSAAPRWCRGGRRPGASPPR